MRSGLALTASALAGLAAAISSLDHDDSFVPFFVGLTFLGGLEAWAAHDSFEGARRTVARSAALLWGLAATWVAVLLVMSVTVWQASSPPPQPEALYAGLTATVYHVVGLFGGAVLVMLSAFAPAQWFERLPRMAREAG